MTGFSSDEYSLIRDGCIRSAKALVPTLVNWIHPQSVVDVGCGEGHWLEEFHSQGSALVQGVDSPMGSPLNPSNGVKMLHWDLEQDFSSLLLVDAVRPDGYDLCLCLEVAEHLSPQCADRFVQQLCRLSKNVVFSAAIPGQGGMGHVNERWQSYWVEKFNIQQYLCFDFRSFIWTNAAIEPWYRQNILWFSNRHKCSTFTGDLVHPTIYSYNHRSPAVFQGKEPIA